MCLQTKGSYDFTMQSFKSYKEYKDHVVKEHYSQTTFSFGIAVPGVFEVAFNFNNEKYSKAERKIRRASSKVRCLFSRPLCNLCIFKNKTNDQDSYKHTHISNICNSNLETMRYSSPNLQRFFSQTNSFVRAKAELELAQYILKSDDLMLHPEFLQRLRSLPQTYVYGEYRQIYRDYGTHYITEAALGGDYEYTVILNKEKLEKTGSKC